MDAVAVIVVQVGIPIGCVGLCPEGQSARRAIGPIGARDLTVGYAGRVIHAFPAGVVVGSGGSTVVSVDPLRGIASVGADRRWPALGK